MASKVKVTYVTATIRIKIVSYKGVKIPDVLDDMDYNFKSQTPGAEVADTEWLESDIQKGK